MPDLVALNDQGNLSLLLNNGNSGFAVSDRSIGLSGGGMAVGDFNNDGRLDIAATNPISDELVILLGNGSGGFQSLSTDISIAPITVAAGDFDHNGKLDSRGGRWIWLPIFDFDLAGKW